MTIRETKALKQLEVRYNAASLRPSDMSPGVVYHYTSAAGLYGIIAEGVLRATNFSYLNDSSEIHHGRSIAAKIITRQLAREHPQSHRRVLTTVQEALEEVGQRSRVLPGLLLREKRLAQSMARLRGRQGSVRHRIRH